MPRAGRMNRKIVIEKPSATQDAYGQPLDTWATHATVFAEMNPYPSMGKEADEGNQVHAEITHKIILRDRAGITANMRVKFGTRYFQILNTKRPYERGHELHLLCRELM